MMFWHTNQYEPFLYGGGMVLLSILAALVIAVTIHPGSQLRSILGWEPLRWVGERSYAIYLWHYPIIVLTTPLNAPPGARRATLQLLATFLIAAASWRYIEQPVRHGALGRQWQRIRQHDRTRSRADGARRHMNALSPSQLLAAEPTLVDLMFEERCQ